MRIYKDTPFEFGFQVWELSPGEPSLMVVLKATFDLAPEGPCPIAEAQALVTGEVPFEDGEPPSNRLGSDMAILKSQAEWLLAGSAYAPGGEEATVVPVKVRVGPLEKKLAVWGDRRWEVSWSGRRPSAPAPFSKMPLRWERSFGGPEVAANPVGVGLHEVEGPEGDLEPLPNIEDPKHPVVARDHGHPPAGAFPIPRTWEARTRLTGTYDERWQRERWPYFPEDFDWSYFNEAPEDQRLPKGRWAGDEELELHGLHPERPRLHCRLPGLRGRCFVERRLERHQATEPADEAKKTLMLSTRAAPSAPEEVDESARTGRLDLRPSAPEDPSEEPRDRSEKSRLSRELSDAEELNISTLKIRRDGDLNKSQKQKEVAKDESSTTLRITRRVEESKSKRLTAEERAALPSVSELLAGGSSPAAAEAEGPDPSAPREERSAEHQALYDRLAESIPRPRLEEVVLSLDTITIDTDARQVFCLFRGLLKGLKDDSLEEIGRIFFLHERISARHGRRYYESWLHRLLVEEALDEALMEAEAPREGDEGQGEEPEEELEGLEGGGAPDEPAAGSPKEQAAAAARAILAGWAGASRDATPEELRAALEAEGLELPEALAAPAPPEPEPEPELPEEEEHPSVLRLGLLLRRRRGLSCAGMDLSGARLRALDLSGIDLRGAILTEADLGEAILTGAALSEAVLVRADLRGADLSLADLRGAALEEAQLDGAAFRQAQLEGASAERATGSRADFGAATLTGADLSGARLVHARFQGVEARGAVLSGADLSHSDWAGAHLEDADLEGAVAEGASFEGCHMKDLRAAEGARFDHSRFLYADAPGSQWQGSSLVGAELSFSVLSEADLSEADLRGARIVRAELRGAVLDRAELAAAVLTGSNLLEARLEGADLRGADLRDANLFGAQLWRAHTEGALLEGATLERTHLEGEG